MSYYPWEESNAETRNLGLLPAPDEKSSSELVPEGTTLAEVRAGALPPARLPPLTRPAGDYGAQVGRVRNLEFSAGGRSDRISTGPYTKA